MKSKYRIQAMILLAITLGDVLFAAAQPENEARKSAEQWLSLIDAGEYLQSWQTAAEYFQRAMPREQWSRTLNAVRKPLGSLISRKIRSAKYTRSLPGAPDGEYVILRFQTSFANKLDAIETVTPMLEKEGQWRVSGYFIK
ncbi:MAG: DUF4019 domain-containing protein [Verrucomicrobia bacterium]|nr:DUF4019 domain-containing protein [Verrucomicrobiota bacterium]